MKGVTEVEKGTFLGPTTIVILLKEGVREKEDKKEEVISIPFFK